MDFDSAKDITDLWHERGGESAPVLALFEHIVEPVTSERSLRHYATLARLIGLQVGSMYQVNRDVAIQALNMDTVCRIEASHSENDCEDKGAESWLQQWLRAQARRINS